MTTNSRNPCGATAISAAFFACMLGVVAFVLTVASGQGSAFASPTIYTYDTAAQHSSATSDERGFDGP
jgi:hypothetical protein